LLAGTVCLLCLRIFWPAPAASQAWVSVVGEVTTEGGEVIPSGVSVLVEWFDGRRITEQSANRQGLFQIDNLRRSRRPFRLTIKAEGYYTVQQELDLTQATGTVTVHVVLTRVSRTKQAEQALPVLTDMSAPRPARKAFERGWRDLQANNLAGAQRNFAKAVAEYPCYARAQTGLAAVLIGKGDLGAAEAALHKAIQCDPGFPDGLASLGRVLNSEKRFAETETTLQQGLRVSPKAWQLYDQLAAAHYGLGFYSQAREEWLRVTTLNPEAPPELHAKLSAAYLREGNTEKAYAEMQTYLRLEPEGRYATQLKSLMHQIEFSGALHTSADQGAQPTPQKP
jgi:tetratricopeptide (TPR) repeat protein